MFFDISKMTKAWLADGIKRKQDFINNYEAELADKCDRIYKKNYDKIYECQKYFADNCPIEILSQVLTVVRRSIKKSEYVQAFKKLDALIERIKAGEFEPISEEEVAENEAKAHLVKQIKEQCDFVCEFQNAQNRIWSEANYIARKEKSVSKYHDCERRYYDCVEGKEYICDLCEVKSNVSLNEYAKALQEITAIVDKIKAGEFEPKEETTEATDSEATDSEATDSEAVNREEELNPVKRLKAKFADKIKEQCDFVCEFHKAQNKIWSEAYQKALQEDPYAYRYYNNDCERRYYDCVEDKEYILDLCKVRSDVGLNEYAIALQEITEIVDRIKAGEFEPNIEAESPETTEAPETAEAPETTKTPKTPEVPKAPNYTATDNEEEEEEEEEEEYMDDDHWNDWANEDYDDEDYDDE